MTNGTPEPNCNTASMVGPPNHYGCPTFSVIVQIPEGAMPELLPSGDEVSVLL